MKIFKTVSFHIVKPCNMSCTFCYATYNSHNIGRQLTLDKIQTILWKLHEAGVQKVTFAGGEPMLHPHLAEAIIYAKAIGLTTSIITNGSMLTREWLTKVYKHLDWIGISIDSLNTTTNVKIGRVSKSLPLPNYFKLVDIIKDFGIKLKVNTVVNNYNKFEVMTNFIDWSGTTRWKVFQALRVEGQNEEQFEAIRVSRAEFKNFVGLNGHPSMVVEDNDAMSGSYLLINPAGQFYENWGTQIHKSDSLIDNSVEHCLSQINLDEEMFIKRGGIYNW